MFHTLCDCLHIDFAVLFLHFKFISAKSTSVMIWACRDKCDVMALYSPMILQGSEDGVGEVKGGMCQMKHLFHLSPHGSVTVKSL